MFSHSFNQDCLRRPDTIPKAKPGLSRKGKNKAPKTTIQRDQSSSTGLSAEAEQALIDKIANSVVDKLIKGSPTTEHEGEEHFNSINWLPPLTIRHVCTKIHLDLTFCS